MRLTRRAAAGDDLELLFEINCAAMKDHVIRTFGGWDQDWQRKSYWESTDPSTHEIFYEDQEPVGYWSIRRADTELYLERIALFPRFQNRGIGTILINELVAEARATGRQLKLRVFLTNQARLLYERSRLSYRADHCHALPYGTRGRRHVGAH